MEEEELFWVLPVLEQGRVYGKYKQMKREDICIVLGANSLKN